MTMTLLEWLRFIQDICSDSAAPSYWRELAILSNLAVAAAYFWLPIVMVVVWRRWKTELPFPWLWVGFVLFITACGTSHVVHALHATQEIVPYSYLKLGVLVLTAAISLATAAGFTWILPRVMRFTSPAAVRDRLEAEVRSKTADLEAALAHERLLLQELHHRVKNNLQVTASLVSLHMARAAPSSRDSLAALRGRIVAMGDVHAQLQHVGAGAFFAQEFARMLCARLQGSFARERVDCRIIGQDYTVPLDLAASFALILNEVVTNALIHGHRPGGQGTLTVMTSLTEGQCVLVVEDNGIGPISPIEGGIGSLLIESLAVQLGGSFEYRPGARVAHTSG
jgi:two-component sensor histidine kinase